MSIRRLFLCSVLASLGLLFGCATPVARDYSAWQQAKPATLLVLPPINESPEIKATPGAWASATLPLAEAGYYVLPVTLVDETFRQNGVTSAEDAHSIATTKLREVFGADAAVYIRIKQYGTKYAVVASETRVDLEARIVDLKTGASLWEGTASASSSESQNNQGGLAALLIKALINQVVGTATDAAYTYAGVASTRLLGAPRFNGVLPGPRSPLYGQPLPGPGGR